MQNKIIKMEHLDEEYKKLIMNAFVLTTVQLLGYALVGLMYLNYVLFRPYLIAIFWSLTFSIILQKPKKGMINYFRDLEPDESYRGYVLFYRVKKLFFKVKEPLSGDNLNILIYAAILALSILFCGYISWAFHVPFTGLIAGPLVISLLYIVAVLVLPKSYRSTLVAFLLLGIAVMFLAILMHFFIFQSAQEIKFVINGVKVLIEENNENIQVNLEYYGLNTESLLGYLEEGQMHVDQFFLDNFGFNVTYLFMRESTLEEEVMNNKSLSVNWRNLDMEFFSSLWENNIVGYQHLEGVKNVGSVFLDSFSKLGYSVFFLVQLLYGSIISVTIFFGLLTYLLTTETYFLEDLVQAIPVQDHRRILSSVETSVNGVVLGNLAISFSHGLVTYIFLFIFGLDFMYITTFVSAVMALFPFVSSWVVFIPHLIVLYVKGDDYIIHFLIGLLCSQIVLLYYVDPTVHKRIPNSHPYLIGLSLVLGMDAFGLQGVFLGPLIVTITVILFKIFSSETNRS